MSGTDKPLIFHAPRYVLAREAASRYLARCGTARTAPAGDANAPGHLLYLGDDRAGRPVYAVALPGTAAYIALRACRGLTQAYGQDPGRLFFLPAGTIAHLVDGMPGDDELRSYEGPVSLRATRLPPAGSDAPKVFYHCFGSAHTSVTAANIHLGRLPSNRRPSVAEVMAAPEFDRARHSDIGTVIFMGTDGDGKDVYVVGLGHYEGTIREVLDGVMQALRLPAGRTFFVNAINGSGIFVRAGGYLSRRLGLVQVGRPLAAYGIIKNYSLYVRAAEQGRRWRPRLGTPG